MENVNIDRAKTNLSGLLSRMELGKEIIISNGIYPNSEVSSVS